MKLETVDDYIEQKLTHSIHTTERRSFRGCRRRWNWVFREYYYPTVTAKPLEFGVAFHLALETYWNPTTWHDRETAAALSKMVFAKKVDEQFKEYGKTQMPTEEAKDDYAERKALGLAMLDYYFTKVSPRYDNEIQPVRTEIKFEVPITDELDEPIWCKCDSCFRRTDAWLKTQNSWDSCDRNSWKGLPVTYGGRIDMLGIDSEGYYWVFDWKTAARLSGQVETPWGSEDHLLWDDQITSYCWALWKLGLPVAGFIYVEFKKTVPQEPEPLARPYKGRSYSTNKQNSYDAETFKETVITYDNAAYEAGLYDDFLTYLKEQGETAYHVRHKVIRNHMELHEAGKNIFLEALEITNPKLNIYPNPGRFSCSTCAFAVPCLGKNRGEDYQYYLDSMYDKRRYHYYEDQPLSTDKPGRG